MGCCCGIGKEALRLGILRASSSSCIAGIRRRRRRPILPQLTRRRHVQGVQRRVAIFQVVVIGKAVRTALQTRLVVNGGPRRLVFGIGGEGGADAKGQTVTERKLQAAEQVLTWSGIGQVGDAAGAAVAGAGVVVVGFLRARGKVVGDGNGSIVAKSGTILRGGLDGHGARGTLALRGATANGGAADGTLGVLLQALFQAFRVQDVQAALDLHQRWRSDLTDAVVFCILFKQMAHSSPSHPVAVGGKA